MQRKIIAVFLLSLLAGFISCQSQDKAASEGGAEAVQQYVYQFTGPVRPDLLTTDWTEDEQRSGRQHFERLKSATAAGKVILAGLSLDMKGPAVVIFEAESEEAARGFMENDPFVRDSVFYATIHPFRVSLIRDPRD